MSKPIKVTIKQRANHDPHFRNETLKEALEALNCGDIDVAKALIKNCLKEDTDETYSEQMQEELEPIEDEPTDELSNIRNWDGHGYYKRSGGS
tara:strand:+ start:305 stop:583 length:279 start_codon:yes stop_codon:yes gene_type:complete